MLWEIIFPQPQGLDVDLFARLRKILSIKRCWKKLIVWYQTIKGWKKVLIINQKAWKSFHNWDYILQPIWSMWVFLRFFQQMTNFQPVIQQVPLKFSTLASATAYRCRNAPCREKELFPLPVFSCQTPTHAAYPPNSSHLKLCLSSAWSVQASLLLSS